LQKPTIRLRTVSARSRWSSVASLGIDPIA
jgi:hypothetical protein